MHKNTFIIVTWNNVHEIGSLLKSIVKYESDCDIKIVDNNSTDTTVEYIKSNFKNVDVIECSDNIGFAKANNLGMKSVTTDYVTLINPDTSLTKPFVAKLINEINSDNNGIIGCKLVNQDGSLQPSIYKFQSTISILIEQFRIGKVLPEKLKEKLSPENTKHIKKMHVDWVIGAFLFMKTATYNEIGGFSEDYFLYAEDMDICYKCHLSGRSVLFDPSVNVLHLGGSSERQDVTETKSSKLIKSFFIFAKKYNIHGNVGALKFSYALKSILVFPMMFFMPRFRPIYKRYSRNMAVIDEMRKNGFDS